MITFQTYNTLPDAAAQIRRAVFTQEQGFTEEFDDIDQTAYHLVLFLDEIQSCPNARTALKSFSLDGRIDVISSGSLLGLYYKEVTSYPVGYEIIIDLYPLDFEEFLWAVGIKKDTIEYAKKCFDTIQSMDEYILRQFSEQFKMYMLVGGMPNVVNEYIKTNSLSKVLTLQKAIVENYLFDVVKFAEPPIAIPIIKIEI